MVLAAVMPRPDAPVELVDLPEPELEPDSALLAVEFSEVCGTDVHLLHGRLRGVPYPIVPGHVATGRLSRVRGRITDLDGRTLREGERVTFLDVHGTCHACWFCLVAKASTRCPNRKVYGITYGVEDRLAGGWSEAIYLRPGTRVLSLDGVDSKTLMAGGCGLPTALHAVERADIAVADTVLVLGVGPVGLSCIALARLRGAARVLAIGAPAPRLKAALAVGASEALDLVASDFEARLGWVLERTGGRGADVTIEAAGAPEAVTQAMRFTRDTGRVVVVGQYTDQGDVTFNPHQDLNRKHLDVRGCWGSDFSHFHRATLVIKDPELSRPWQSIPVVEYPLRRAHEALADVERGGVVKALIRP